MEEDILKHSEEIKKLFNGHSVDIIRIMDGDDYININIEKPRKKAKHQFSHIIDKISRRTGLAKEQCEIPFSYHYVKCKYEDAEDIKDLMGPIFHSQ